MFRLNNGKLKNGTKNRKLSSPKTLFSSFLDYILNHMRNKRGFLKRKSLKEHLSLVESRVFLGTRALFWY